MPKLAIESLKIHFRIDDDLLASRKHVGSFINSFSMLIVETFHDTLMKTPYFSKYTAMLDNHRFKTEVNHFVCDLFRTPFDDRLIEHIRYVASIHYDMGLEPADLTTGFDILREAVLELAMVNEEVRRNIKTILKMFHLAEFVIHQSRSIELLQQAKSAEMKNSSFPIIEKLLEINVIHKNSMQLLTELEESDAPKQLLEASRSSLVRHASECRATLIYKDILRSSKGYDDLPVDVDYLMKEHEQYHHLLDSFIGAIDSGSGEQHDIFKQIHQIYVGFMTPLEDMLDSKFNFMGMIVTSAVEFINSSSQRLQTLTLSSHGENISVPQLTEKISRLVMDHFGWCIETLEVAEHDIEHDPDITFGVLMKSCHIMIGIDLKEQYKNTLLNDVIMMGLENIKFHLLNLEREKSLEKLATRAEEANRSKDVFLANMSHELRTPLNAIIGFSQILGAKKDIPEQYHTYLEKISIAGKNLLTLVNTILDFAKLEAGKLQFNPENTNTYSVIKEVITLVEPLAGKKEIVFSYPKFSSHVLFMDPQLIKQVLVNLLTNAIKFTPEEGKVTLDAQFNSDGDFHFSVTDTGIGIPLESQKNLFEPFVQVDNPFQKASEGTGLGLAISKKIVEDLHGGKIWLESIPDKGSTFHITLPFQKNEVFVDRIKHEGVPKLLIVEDTRDYINILVERLRGSYDMTITNSINEAKKILEKEWFDIGIYDFFLIDGISTELLTFMEDNSLDFPILVISAEQDSDLMRSFQEASFVEGIFNKQYINDVMDALTDRMST
jgi:signal transduction histidine kinase